MRDQEEQDTKFTKESVSARKSTFEMLEKSLTQKYDQILKNRLVHEFDEFFKLVNYDMKQKMQITESNFRQNLLDLEKRLNFLS